MLRELRITSVVNCTPSRKVDPEAGCPNYFKSEITYLRLPVFDNRGEDLLAHFEACSDFIDSRLSFGSVLIHCNKGVSRSASFVCAYLMRSRKLNFDEALSVVRAARPIAKPNDAFQAQLKRYENRIDEVRNNTSNEPASRKAKIGPSLPPSQIIGPSLAPAVPYILHDNDAHNNRDHSHIHDSALLTETT